MGVTMELGEMTASAIGGVANQNEIDEGHLGIEALGMWAVIGSLLCETGRILQGVVGFGAWGFQWACDLCCSMPVTLSCHGFLLWSVGVLSVRRAGATR